MRTTTLFLLCMIVASASAFIFHRRGGCGGGHRFGGGFRFGGGGGFRHGGGFGVRFPLIRRPGGCGGGRPPPPPPPPRKCMYNGFPMQEGAVLLNTCCRYLLTCTQGFVKPTPISCSANSKCSNGKCICNAGFAVTGSQHGGLVPTCEVQGCRNKLNGNKLMKEGEYSLSADCKRMAQCRDGKDNYYDFGCPVYSSCQNGKCICDAGMTLIGSEYAGLVQNCHCPCEDVH